MADLNPQQKNEFDNSAKKIKTALQTKPCTFTELIKATGLSRATVNNHLKNMEAKGETIKKFQNGKTLNCLTKTGRDAMIPELFFSMVQPYLFGFNMRFGLIVNNESISSNDDWNELVQSRKMISEVGIKRSINYLEKPFALEDRVRAISRRLSAYAFFTFYMYMRERKESWLKYSSVMSFNVFVGEALGFNLSNGKSDLDMIFDAEDMIIHSKEGYFTSPSVKYEISAEAKNEALHKIEGVLEKLYSEELAFFEKTLKEILEEK